jgi:catechol 2,3-dioxygenase-like lactoylglutathione lyase family enzyme
VSGGGTPPLPRLDHVQLAAPAGCEEAARRFFGELVGLEEIEKPEALRGRGGCWFRLGNGELHVGVATDFAPAIKAHPGLTLPAASLDALAARLSAAGAPVAWDEAIPGRRRFYAEDPWGNRLEFLADVASQAPPTRR